MVVPSGQPVIGFRIIQHYSLGFCLPGIGYPGNFLTDNLQGQFVGRNIWYDPAHGYIDPFVYLGYGQPLVPTYHVGNWVIRACVKPSSSGATVSWTGNSSPGSYVSLQFSAPGRAGDMYFALVSGSIVSGFPTPWGRVPLDFDPIFNCYLGGCRSTMVNAIGSFDAQGQAVGGIKIPNLAWLTNSGLTLHVGFVTFDQQGFFPWKSISAPSAPIVIN